MNENKVIIMGRMVRQPELKTSGDTVLCFLNIAVGSVWIDKPTGEKRESVEFIGISVFGKRAEHCAQYLEKGQLVYVEGRIKNRVEQTPDGNRSHTGIVADMVQFGPKSSNAGGNGVDTEQTSYTAPKAPQGPIQPKSKPTHTVSGIEYPEGPNPEDIPF